MTNEQLACFLIGLSHRLKEGIELVNEELPDDIEREEGIELVLAAPQPLFVFPITGEITSTPMGPAKMLCRLTQLQEELDDYISTLRNEPKIGLNDRG